MASSGAALPLAGLAGLPISPSALSGRRQLPRLHLPCSAQAQEAPQQPQAVTASPSTLEEQVSSLPSFQDAYKLGEFLGSGSMSVVRRCVRKLDGQIFAVKCVTAIDEEVRQFSRDEYELVRTLRHPAIITFRAWFEGPVSAWIVMDLCSGGSVESFVRREGALREPQVQDLGFQLIRGIDYLHHKRVVHRDLKPANLLLNRQVSSTAPSPAHRPLEGELLWPWQLKITDFNSAKRVGACNGLLLTDRGTQLYNAPELRFGRLWNERIDIWASGLCLYFMLRKTVPFNIGDQKVADTLLSGKLPHIDWSMMSPLAGNLIRQCLFVDPCDRPTAMELRLHLFFASKRMPESRKGSIEQFEVADRRESKESLGTSTSSFTASRRMSLESIPVERSVMVSSCGLIFVGAARAGEVRNRGSVWLEVEEQLQRTRGGSKGIASRAPFLGVRSFPVCPSQHCPSPYSSQLAAQRQCDGRKSSRVRSHSMYLSTPKACDAVPRSPQQAAKSHSQCWKEPRSFDVLLRMANEKFRQMNELLDEDVQPRALRAEHSAESMMDKDIEMREDEERSVGRPRASDKVSCFSVMYVAFRFLSQLCSWKGEVGRRMHQFPEGIGDSICAE
ncbi:unnamed protein product [Durusdinium trenchii]|uniref:Protein kinase domain-containing protein n=3 Tax=Durusdinium trenchii TaxID=1381693 RepID=A0ABP0MUW9_9DINO